MSATGAELPLGLVLSARHHNNWPETQANKDYVQKFFKKTGRYPTYAAEGAYAGILAIAQAVEKVGNPNDTEALVKALEGMKISLPEDPEGFTSYIDPATHQIVQVQAIGVTVANDQFPPAKRMLGNWKIYKAEDLLPPKEYIESRQQEVRSMGSMPGENLVLCKKVPPCAPSKNSVYWAAVRFPPQHGRKLNSGCAHRSFWTRGAGEDLLPKRLSPNIFLSWQRHSVCLAILELGETQMDLSFIIGQLLSGLTMATLLFLVASGLTLIFGVGNVFNFAHGSFYMIGAYLAYQAVSIWHTNFWAATFVAAAGAGILGMLAESLFLRRIYGRAEEGGFQILLTYSFILVIDDLVKLIWGTEYKSLLRPRALAGRWR